jgi:hypothetical protein
MMSKLKLEILIQFAGLIDKPGREIVSNGHMRQCNLDRFGVRGNAEAVLHGREPVG